MYKGESLMSEENTKKMNFFERVITSIKDFDKYQIFAVERLGVAIRYLVILIIIFSLVGAITFTVKFANYINGGIKYFEENINEVSYRDGKLSINARRRIDIC